MNVDSAMVGVLWGMASAIAIIIFYLGRYSNRVEALELRTGRFEEQILEEIRDLRRQVNHATNS